MKIGIDCRMYGSRFTGIGIYVERLVEYLAKHDHENEYVLFLSKSGMSDCEVSLPNFKKVETNARHYSFAEQVVFPLQIAREKLDLMHFTHFNAPLAYRGKSVVTIHDLTLSFYPGRKMTSSFHRFGYSTTIGSIAKRAEKIFSVSEHTKKDLVEILDVDENKIVTIHNGVSAERFSADIPAETVEKTKRGLGIEGRYLLYTGVFREHKNLVRLVEAFGQIAEKYPDVDLVLAGKEDPGYRDVRDAIVRLSLSGRVRLPGFIDNREIVALYKGAEAYVFPSLYEGFWLPVLEAMAAGVSVLCSKGSSLSEVAGEGNALFFDPLRVDDMARALDEFLKNPEKKATLVERGRKWVKRFSWDSMGASILEEYQKLDTKN